MWLKIKEPGLRRIWSLVPFAKGAILVQPFGLAVVLSWGVLDASLGGEFGVGLLSGVF